MQRYFVDTWFFIARLHERDSSHRFAMRVTRSLGNASLLTHDGVLTELLTFFSGHGDYWRKEVTGLVHGVVSGTSYKSVPLSRELFLEALTMYEERPDKAYSLVDCMSMRVMKRHALTHALTNDHHFRQEGFVVVSE